MNNKAANKKIKLYIFPFLVLLLCCYHLILFCVYISFQFLFDLCPLFTIHFAVRFLQLQPIYWYWALEVANIPMAQANFEDKKFWSANSKLI